MALRMLWVGVEQARVVAGRARQGVEASDARQAQHALCPIPDIVAHRLQSLSFTGLVGPGYRGRNL